MRPAWWRPALALLALEAAVALLWLRYNATPPRGGSEFPYDLLYQFYPFTEFAAGRLADGALPLWNPSGCGGLPLLATLQVAALYPGTWLSVLLGPERGMPLALLLACGVGGALFAWTLRVLEYGWYAAVLGGVSFVFASLLGLTFWPAAVSTTMWLPWILGCVVLLCRHWQWRWWIGLSTGVALQLLAGYPQFATYGLYLVVAIAASLLWEQRRARGWTGIATTAAGLALAFAIGAALAAVQLVPTAELIGEGARATRLTPGEVHYLGSHGSIRGFFANAIDPTPTSLSIGYRNGAGFLGIPALVLAAMGLVAPGRVRLHAATLLVGALGLLLAEGYHGAFSGVYELYARLPVIGSFRTPERHLLLPVLAGIVLATSGLDLCARGATRLSPRRRRIAVVAGALVALGVGLGGGFESGAQALAALAAVAVALTASRRALHTGALAALAVLLLFSQWRGTPEMGSLRSFPVEWSRSIHAQGHRVAGPEAEARLRGTDGLDRLALVRLEPPVLAGPLGHLQQLECYEPLAPHAWQRLAELAGAEHPRGLDAGPERFPALWDAASVRRSMVLNLKRPISREQALAAVEQQRARFREGSGLGSALPSHLRVDEIENPDALPRAYLATHWEIRPLEAALLALLRGDFDFEQGILLEQAPAKLLPSAPPRPVEPATIVSYAPERVVIQVDAGSPALLVLTDTFYPGWRARVDGDDTEILRANGLFRAVPVPTGRHEVVFSYEPASLRVGLLGSMLGALLLVGIPLAARRSR